MSRMTINGEMKYNDDPDDINILVTGREILKS